MSCSRLSQPKRSRAFGNGLLHGQAVSAGDPVYAPGWVNMGAVQNLLQDFQGATKTLRKAIQKDKKCASAYYNLGIAQKAMKMNSMAISAYREAIKLDPTMPEPYANLANIFVEMKNPAQAIRTAEDGLAHCAGSRKLQAILQKARQLKEGNRRNAAPLGRLVDEAELAKQHVRTTRRELSAAERNTERDAFRELVKTIRRCTRPTVEMLDGPFQQHLHTLHLAAAQNDARGNASVAYEEMLKTITELDRLRGSSKEAIAEIRANLERTDPGL
jgi:tetratricopeptide (TPR) repeat protein